MKRTGFLVITKKGESVNSYESILKFIKLSEYVLNRSHKCCLFMTDQDNVYNCLNIGDHHTKFDINRQVTTKRSNIIEPIIQELSKKKKQRNGMYFSVAKIYIVFESQNVLNEFQGMKIDPNNKGFDLQLFDIVKKWYNNINIGNKFDKLKTRFIIISDNAGNYSNITNDRLFGLCKVNSSDFDMFMFNLAEKTLKFSVFELTSFPDCKLYFINYENQMYLKENKIQRVDLWSIIFSPIDKYYCFSTIPIEQIFDNEKSSFLINDEYILTYVNEHLVLMKVELHHDNIDLDEYGIKIIDKPTDTHLFVMERLRISPTQDKPSWTFTREEDIPQKIVSNFTENLIFESEMRECGKFVEIVYALAATAFEPKIREQKDFIVKYKKAIMNPSSDDEIIIPKSIHQDKSKKTKNLLKKYKTLNQQLCTVFEHFLYANPDHKKYCSDIIQNLNEVEAWIDEQIS